jgi:hypothetical protein
MGRKGMKGFIKTAGKAQDSDEEATGSSQTAAVTSSGSKAAPAEAQPAAAAAAAGSEGEEDEEQHEGPESRGHMLQRHKRVRGRARGSEGRMLQGAHHVGWVVGG